MSVEYVGGRLVIEWFLSAWLLTAAIIGVLIAIRHLSLRVLEGAPDRDDMQRYERGARWGWLVAVASFVAVVSAVTLIFGYTAWDFRAVALAWLTALLPVAGSIGFLMIPELMGQVVWAQALWDELGGRSIDWPRYRVITARLERGGTRWAYYTAWVVGSAALTVGPLWTHTLLHG